MSHLIKTILLMICFPIAVFKFFRFFRKLADLTFYRRSIDDLRNSLERSWVKSSASNDRKTLSLIIFLCVISFLKPIEVLAIKDVSQDNYLLEDKVSNNFSKKFCNSIGFGISKDSSLKFSIGETEKEIKSKTSTNKIDMDILANKISEKIVDSCGFSIGLTGEKGVEEINRDLIELNLLNRFNPDKSY